jgi:hypothetical protein
VHVPIPSPTSIWRLTRAVERIFELDAKLREGLQEVDQRFAALELRVLQIEAEKGMLVTEARAAAATAASAVASLHTSDLSRHIGALQQQMRELRDGGMAGTDGPARRRAKRVPPSDQET